jgi:hypothetical protein
MSDVADEVEKSCTSPKNGMVSQYALKLNKRDSATPEDASETRSHVCTIIISSVKDKK